MERDNRPTENDMKGKTEKVDRRKVTGWDNGGSSCHEFLNTKLLDVIDDLLERVKELEEGKNEEL